MQSLSESQITALFPSHTQNPTIEGLLSHRCLHYIGAMFSSYIGSSSLRWYLDTFQCETMHRWSGRTWRLRQMWRGNKVAGCGYWDHMIAWLAGWMSCHSTQGPHNWKLFIHCQFVCAYILPSWLWVSRLVAIVGLEYVNGSCHTGFFSARSRALHE